MGSTGARLDIRQLAPQFGWVNYAQCEDHASWEAVMARLRERDFLERNRRLGTAAPGLYDVVYTLGR